MSPCSVNSLVFVRNSGRAQFDLISVDPQIATAANEDGADEQMDQTENAGSDPTPGPSSSPAAPPKKKVKKEKL